jgi:hypothetical protein
MMTAPDNDGRQQSSETSMPGNYREASRSADDLAAALVGFSKQLNESDQGAIKRDKRRGRQLLLLLLTFILGITLIAFVAVDNVRTSTLSHQIGEQANQIEQQALAIHQNQITSCQTTNLQRDNEREIWDFVLGFFRVPHPGETAQIAQANRQFMQVIKTKVVATFPDRDCTKAYEIPGGK